MTMDGTENRTDVLINLRKRLTDLQRSGAFTEAGFGTYQQTLIQILQECERRRATCSTQAETLRRQAAAAEAEGHAFSVMSSIVLAVVNGFADREAVRAAEEAARARAEAEAKARGGTLSASGAVLEPPPSPPVAPSAPAEVPQAANPPAPGVGAPAAPQAAPRAKPKPSEGRKR